MKKLFLALAFVSSLAFAEASFDQIENLIQQQQYSAAAAGLEEIIKNHPKSAKAFYAMAQAQAGLGNQEKAKKALDIATGLNPTLDFAPASSVASLREAITPQVKKIEAIEESHFWRNFLLAGLLAVLIIYFAIKYKEKMDAEEDAAFKAAREAEEAEHRAESKRRWQESIAQQEAERKAELAAEEALKSHKNYNHERFDPANPDKLKSVKQFKAEQAEAQAKLAEKVREANARAERAEMDARLARSNASSGPAHTTVVNNSSNDMLTGVLIGNMLSDHGHHETTRVVEREVIREVPAPSRSSSWDDDTPSRSSSRSSSWDDDSSSSSSSSWSSSSSSSSSSWDSSSSSSDSSSSSSWD